jgi:hypothetical protein
MLMHIDHHEDGIGGVLLEDPVDLNIVWLEPCSCCVPSHDVLIDADLVDN